jgi:two-component system, sensor histidine kinase LadS
MQFLKYFIFSFLLFFTTVLNAQSLTELGEKDEYFLKNYDVLEDEHKEYTIEQVSSPGFSAKFVANKEKMGVNHNLNSAYWLRFNIKDISEADKYWLIEAYDFKIDHLDLFFVDENGAIQQKKSGDALPFATKAFHHKNLVFNLPTAKDTTKTFYARIEANEYVVFILVLRSYQRFINYALSEYWFFGIFYGIIVLIVLLNLFLFITLKDTTHLLYVWYVLSVGVYSMTTSGIGFQYLWPDYPVLNMYSSSFAALSVVISALLYCKSFLIPNINAPFIRIVLYTVIGLRLGIFIFQFIFNPTELWDPLLDWAALFIAYLAGIYCWVKGFKPSRFYVIAFSFVFVGFLISSLLNVGILKTSSIFVVYSLNFAIVLEIIFLSLALADRVNTFKKDKETEQKEKINQLVKNDSLQAEIINQLKENEALKDKVNKELEEKVRERTVELEAANEEIHRMNEILQADNVKLESSVKDLSKARVMQKIVSFEEFQNIYSDENACLDYLSNLKWAKGYKCEKCGNTNYSKGPVPYSRRCSKCSYIESATANTIFYRLKFPIVKAFYMVFLVSNRNEITADELSEKLSLRRQTCWAFKRKVLDAIQAKKRPKTDTDGWSYLVLGHIEERPLKKTQKEEEE